MINSHRTSIIKLVQRFTIEKLWKKAINGLQTLQKRSCHYSHVLLFANDSNVFNQKNSLKSNCKVLTLKAPWKIREQTTIYFCFLFFRGNNA